MARLRSTRRRRSASRFVMPVLIGGCVVFAAYFLLPEGEQPAEAQAQPVPETSAALVKEASTSLSERKAADPAKPAAQPDQKPAAPKPETPAKPVVSATPTTRTAGEAIPSLAFLAEAKQLQDAGKLLESRKVLNDALQSGRLDFATADTVKSRIRDLNQTIIFTPSRRYADDPQQSAYTVQPGDNLVKICRELDVPYAFVARVNAVKPERIRVGQSIKLIKGPIHAVVSKKRFTMDLYLGNLPGKPDSMYLATYRVGLGEAGSTPTGTWEVTRNSKTVNPAWTNPRTGETFGRDDAKNPIGERWIGLTGIAGEAVGAVSYGIHGTIEPETVGTNASMGCIRLVHDDVVDVFDMLSEGKSLVKVIDE